MLTSHFFYIFIFGVLGFVLAIPPNTCIVIVNLQSIRKKEKLGPSDVIFLAKAIVNILLQCLLSAQGMLFVFSPSIFHSGETTPLMNLFNNFLTYYSFWFTVWLSAHYCTNITNLRYGFFIWLKGILTNALNRILFFTALGIFAWSVPIKWAFNVDFIILSFQNSTVEAPIKNVYFHVNYFYYAPAFILGCIQPFFLTLLCLLLTFSFLVRHVWRVKNNDSGSTRPNLRAHVTALRTIFLLLLMFTFFFVSQVLLFILKSTTFTNPILTVSWVFRSLSPSAEAAVIFQASNKLKSLIGRRFWNRTQRNIGT